MPLSQCSPDMNREHAQELALPPGQRLLARNLSPEDRESGVQADAATSTGRGPLWLSWLEKSYEREASFFQPPADVRPFGWVSSNVGHYFTIDSQPRCMPGFIWV